MDLQNDHVILDWWEAMLYTEAINKEANMSEHDALLKTNYKLGKIVGRKVEAIDMVLGCHLKVQDCIDFHNKVGTKPVLLFLISF